MEFTLRQARRGGGASQSLSSHLVYCVIFRCGYLVSDQPARREKIGQSSEHAFLLPTPKGRLRTGTSCGYCLVLVLVRLELVGRGRRDVRSGERSDLIGA